MLLGQAVLCSALLALPLEIIPLPEGWNLARPEWMALVVIFWVMRFPLQLGIGLAWGLGLLQDLVVGTPIGCHALALTVVAYIALLLYQRLRMFSIWQGALVVGVMIGIHQLICQWVQSLSGQPVSGLSVVAPALMSTLTWFVLLPILLRLQRLFEV